MCLNCRIPFAQPKLVLAEGSHDLSHDHSILTALDFFGDLDTCSHHPADVGSRGNTTEEVEIRPKHEGSHKRIHVHQEPDSDVSGDEGVMCEDGDSGEGSGCEEVELLAGHAGLKIKHHSGTKRRRKKKKFDKEAKELLRQQEVGTN